MKKDIHDFFEYDSYELFKVLLDLLKFFSEFCNKYHLQFYAQGGTMLGAVRHQGFIPWDDDIDLAMMRKDYNELLKLINTTELPEPYRFLTPLTDAQYGKGLVRLCNTETTAISLNNALYNYNHGIFIDIFPLDALPDSPINFWVYKKTLKIKSGLLRAACRYNLGNKYGSQCLSFKKKIYYYLLYPFFKADILNKKKIFESFTKTASSYEEKDQKRIGLSTFKVWEKYIYQKEDYNVKIINIPFEDMTIPVPETYDRILRIHFGDDYMTPIQEKTMHGKTLFSTTIPYKKFMEIYKDELIELWIEYKKLSTQ